MTDPRTAVVESKRIAALWAGLLLAPAAALANLEVSYLLVHPACVGADTAPLHVAQLLALLAAVVGALIAWRVWRAEGSQFPGEEGGKRGRSAFLAGLGVWTSALFALVILAQAAPSFVLHPCQ